jgi:hypothetical protein
VTLDEIDHICFLSLVYTLAYFNTVPETYTLAFGFILG